MEIKKYMYKFLCHYIPELKKLVQNKKLLKIQNMQLQKDYNLLKSSNEQLHNENCALLKSTEAFQQKNNELSQKLRKIDGNYLISTSSSPAVLPVSGEYAHTYYVEILSGCNLRCSLCAHGYPQLFQRAHGKMSLELFAKILDKIHEESPSATVSPYHHCEPMLHPQLPEFVRHIKQRGFHCAISFNFNYLFKLNELLDSGLDSLEISVSGFTQQTYEKSHIRGNIDRVKKNMLLLRSQIDKRQLQNFQVTIIYHMYIDNLSDDFDDMKKFTENLGFIFFPTWARSINLELSLLYLRHTNNTRYNYQNLKNDLIGSLPSLPQRYLQKMEKTIYRPEDYLHDSWSDIHLTTCPSDGMSINIRWNGLTNLCPWAFDDRLHLGSFLKSDPNTRFQARMAHPVCQECCANNFPLYCQYVDIAKLNAKASSRLSPTTPPDRRLLL